MAITKIATATVAGSPSVITFSSIPGTYTDLWVVFSLRTNDNAFLNMWFNGLKTNYVNKHNYGEGTSNGSSTRTDVYIGNTNPSSTTANTFGNGSLYIPNYASSINKSFSFEHVQETNASSAAMYIGAGIWSNTAAITSISFENWSTPNTFAIGATATLYGITKGSLAGVTVS